MSAECIKQELNDTDLISTECVDESVLIKLENGDEKEYKIEIENEEIFEVLKEEGRGDDGLDKMKINCIEIVKREENKTDLFENDYRIQECVTYTCKYCDRSFSVKNDYHCHIKGCKRKLNGKNNKTYKCTLCDYQAKRNYHLLRHLKTHTSERPFSCNTCDHRSKSKEQLKRHIMFKHTKERPFNCVLCPFRSVDLCNWRRHLKMHNSRGQMEAHRVQRHVAMRQVQKLFECDMCDYVTDMAGTLRNHKYEKHVDKLKETIRRRIMSIQERILQRPEKTEGSESVVGV